MPAKTKPGISWFIHYSFVVDGTTKEASTFLAEASGCKYFRYRSIVRYIEEFLSKKYGEVNVVVRNFQPVPEEAVEEYWVDQPKESWMITDFTK